MISGRIMEYWGEIDLLSVSCSNAISSPQWLEGVRYRAVDSAGNPLEFLLSATRAAAAAKRFFSKGLGASHPVVPGVITVDQNAAYPKAPGELKAEGSVPEACLSPHRYV